MPTLPKPARRIAVVSSIVVILVCVISLVRGCGDPNAYSGEQRKRLESNAAFSAAETAEFLGDRKNVVLLYLEVPKAKGLKEHRAAFQSVLKDRGFVILAEKAFEPAPPSGFFNPMRWSYSWEELLDIAASHPEAEALVSLAGGPGLGELGIPRRPDGFPGLVVGYTPGAPLPLMPLLDSGVLEMAVVPRLGAKRDPPPATPEERFERFFRVVTPDSGDIPDLPFMVP